MSDRLSNHLFGLEVERMFGVECDRRGIRWALPISDQTACDRVIVTNAGLLAVQIKSTRKMQRVRKSLNRIGLCYAVDNFKRNGAKFHEAGVSVFVVYVEPQARWYLFRASDIGGNRLRFGAKPTGRASAAIENWALLA